jgi:hypothetical protein
MTVLSVVQNVCLVVAIDKPDQVFASTDREMQEMARLANEITDRLMLGYDWQALQIIKTYTGDDVSEGFDLPEDYDRMVEGASLWSSRWTWAFNHILSPDTWLEYQVVPYTFVNGNWIMYGGQLHILPLMASTETVKFFYVSNKIVRDSGGVTKALFTADDDTLRIPEKLLELGMIWQWRANKGLPYAEDMANFESYLNKRIKKDGGSSPIITGNKGFNWKRSGAWAFPQTVGGV